MGLEEVGVKLVAQDEAQFKAALAHAQQSIDKLDHSIDEMDQTNKKTAAGNDALSKSFSKLGQMVVGAFAVDKIVDFAKTAITSASDMNETVSKSRVVFGDTSAAIEAMGETAARSMGISKQEAIAAAATYGNLFTSMGMGKQVSADMSMGLVKLASDLASFNNIPVDVALEKLRAGLVGESEPLKSLGINLNEATLKAKAMELGLSDGKGVLDASAKAQAAYALMLEQSTSAQGDFARTSNGAANQQRILEASMKDMVVQIGNDLLPAWLEVLRVANQLLGTFDQLIQMHSGYTGVLKEHDKSMKKVAKSYGEYRTEMERAAKAAGWEVDAEGRLFKVIEGSFGLRKEYNDEIRITSEQEWFVKKAIDALNPSLAKLVARYMELQNNGYLSADAADRQHEAYTNLGKLMAGETAQAAKDLADAEAAVKQRMSEVTLFMAGPVGKENEKYITDLQAAKDALEKTQSKMREFKNIKGPWTPEQAQAYADLVGAQDKEKAKIQEIETAHDKAMKTILANMLLTKLSYDDLTKEESDFYIKTISDWGLIDQATVDAWNETDVWIEKLHGAKGAADDVATAIKNIPATKDVTVRITTTNTGSNNPVPYGPEPGPAAPVPSTPGWGSGGGNPNGPQIMGAMMQQAFVSAPSNSYSYSNNYNLSVMTSQSPQAAQRSFAIMRMLAGG